MLPKLLKSLTYEELVEFNYKYGSKLETINGEINDKTLHKMETIKSREKECEKKFQERMSNIEKEQKEIQEYKKKIRVEYETSLTKYKLSIEKLLEECKGNDNEIENLKSRVHSCVTLELLFNINMNDVNVDIIDVTKVSGILIEQFLLLLSREHSTDNIGIFANLLGRLNNLSNENKEDVVYDVTNAEENI